MLALLELLSQILLVLSAPLFVFNLLGGIVSGIWLLALGEWKLVASGIFLFLISRWVFVILMAPTLLFLPLVEKLEAKDKIIPAIILAIVDRLYIALVFLAWCGFVFLLFFFSTDNQSEIPTLIWSYGIATAPIDALGQDDMKSGNYLSRLPFFFISVAYITSALLLYFHAVHFQAAALVFCGITCVGMAVEFLFRYAE